MPHAPLLYYCPHGITPTHQTPSTGYRLCSGSVQDIAAIHAVHSASTSLTISADSFRTSSGLASQLKALSKGSHITLLASLVFR